MTTGKKKSIRTDQEFQAVLISTPIKLWKPTFKPLNGKLFVLRETAEDLISEGGLVLNTNIKTQHKFYVVGIADDCIAKDLGMELGDEVLPFMPPDAHISFQTTAEVINGNLVEFGVMWESEMAGFKKHTRKIVWKN